MNLRLFVKYTKVSSAYPSLGYALLFFYIVEVKRRPSTPEDFESARQTGPFTIFD